jgi:hypothetical protein
VVENVLHLTLMLSPGSLTLSPLSRLPQWALPDVTVRYSKLTHLHIHTQSALQNENYSTVKKLYVIGGRNPLPCLPPSVTVLRFHLSSVDTPELVPGTILGLPCPYGSASTGPTNAYPSTCATSSSCSQSYSESTSSVSRGSSSNSDIPMGYS